MNTDYTTYTAEELLADDYFLRSERHPTPASDAFWAYLYATSPALAGEAALARQILEAFDQAGDAPHLLSPEATAALRQQIEARNRRHDRRYRRYLRAATGIAAAVALVAAAGWHLLRTTPPETDYAAIMNSFEQTPDSASNSIRLVLSDNRKIAIDGKESQVDYNDKGEVNINSSQVIHEEADESRPAYNQLIVPHGKRSTVTFGDGTRAWLNSGSRIVYPVNFEKHKREIYAQGEVCLDVARDEKRPFVVKTDHLHIQVLGTKFNVNDCADDPSAHVALLCGQVEISANGEKNILTPNRMLSYDRRKNETRIATVDAAEYIAWTEGYYPFKQECLSVALHKLSKYYGVEFEWDEKVSTLKCSGKFDLKEDLAEAFRTLEKTAPIRITPLTENKYKVTLTP